MMPLRNVPPPSRLQRTIGALLILALVAAGCRGSASSNRPGSPPPAGSPSATPLASLRPTGPTIVSLTFDDGIASAYLARQHLAEHGMHATFFVNSGHVDQDRFMTWEQVRALERDGHEIGGHTALHVDLPLLEPDEADRQICDDRVVLLDHGFHVRNLAYPFGTSNPSVEALARRCGYNSARTTGHVVGTAESIPPADPYALGIGNDGTPTLEEIEDAVTRAVAAGGGWVPILFHGICDKCSDMAISETDFESLLAWLAAQRPLDVSVRTVGEVIGGTLQPPVNGIAAPPAPNGANAVRDASLEQYGEDGQVPDCWTTFAPANGPASWSRTLSAHDGISAQRAVVKGYVENAPRLAILEDLGQCTPSVRPGHRYRITAWYLSTVPISFTTHTRSRTTFSYWLRSPEFPASSTWTEARWVTPAIPDDVDGMSFGVSISDVGSMTVDDLGLDDAAAN
jgi:peptidoglycan/xylan/chitin deacetylase (PgdA/CDA1 family)